ncbi:hypothetical protein BGZ65_006203, partial [Modicella reniformis]
ESLEGENKLVTHCHNEPRCLGHRCQYDSRSFQQPPEARTRSSVDQIYPPAVRRCCQPMERLYIQRITGLLVTSSSLTPPGPAPEGKVPDDNVENFCEKATASPGSEANQIELNVK